MEGEKIVYEGSPSQLMNFWVYVSCLLLVTIPWAIARWLQTRHTRLKVTSERLILTSGVFSRTTSEVELYRIRDVSVHEPFFLRLFGTGHIELFSTDEATARIFLKGYKQPHYIKDLIRNGAERTRQQKRWGTDNLLYQQDL